MDIGLVWHCLILHDLARVFSCPVPWADRTSCSDAQPPDPGLGSCPCSLAGSWQLCQQLFLRLRSGWMWGSLLAAHLFSAKCCHIRRWHWNKVFRKYYLKGLIVSHANHVWSPIPLANWLAQGRTRISVECGSCFCEVHTPTPVFSYSSACVFGFMSVMTWLLSIYHHRTKLGRNKACTGKGHQDGPCHRQCSVVGIRPWFAFLPPSFSDAKWSPLCEITLHCMGFQSVGPVSPWGMFEWLPVASSVYVKYVDILWIKVKIDEAS